MSQDRRPVRIHVPGAEVQDPGDLDLLSETDPGRPPRFYDVSGLPVSLGKVPGCPFRCAMWSDGRPRIFAEARVLSHGKLITEQAFRELVLANKLGN